MMQPFDDSLTTFLIDCRESALDELSSNEQYSDLTARQSILIARIESLLSQEGKDIFEQYREVTEAIKSRVSNQTLLCGLTTQNNILKRFDCSTPEYRSFANTLLG